MAKLYVVINSDGARVGGDSRGLVLINCTGSYDARHNNKVYIADSFLTPSRSRVASGSAPTIVDGTYGMFYCNDTGGDVIIKLGDPSVLKDGKFYFKRIAAGGNNIKFSTFNGENLELSATTPQTFLPTNKDHFCLTTNGTDWFIL